MKIVVIFKLFSRWYRTLHLVVVNDTGGIRGAKHTTSKQTLLFGLPFQCWTSSHVLSARCQLVCVGLDVLALRLNHDPFTKDALREPCPSLFSVASASKSTVIRTETEEPPIDLHSSMASATAAGCPRSLSSYSWLVVKSKQG